MHSPADLPDLPELPDLPDQCDEETLLGGGPESTTGEDTFGLTLEEIPF
jgi:hypothetical protein